MVMKHAIEGEILIGKHKNLEGRVVVITGGSGVLGAAMAKELANQEMKVVILNRTFEKGEKVVKSIEENGGDAIAIAVDVLDEESLIQAREKILSTYGQIDALINAAGGNHPDAITVNEESIENLDGKDFFNLDSKGFRDVFDLNFMGTLLPCQVFGESMLHSKSPTIVNVSSMSGYRPLTKIPAYSAAKAGIINFTEWLAVHFAKQDLRVNAIAPGFFITDQNRNLLLDDTGNYTNRSKKIINSTPMAQFGEPHHLLGTILYLLDESYSGFVTGITIPVDGGFNSYSGV